MPSQVIRGCPHCKAQQAHPNRAKFRHRPAVPVRQQSRLHLCAQTAKQEEQGSIEHLPEDSRAEARRRRRESRQAVETTIDVDPADTEMMTEDGPLPQPEGQKQAPQSETQRQAKELLSRKSQLIMQFTAAGSSLESVIKENRHEIDEVLLKLLARRAQAAAKWLQQALSATEHASQARAIVGPLPLTLEALSVHKQHCASEKPVAQALALVMHARPLRSAASVPKHSLTSMSIKMLHQLNARMEEEKSAVEGLMLLWQRLHAEMQRVRASPATRLLDQVLQAVNPASGLALQEGQQAAETLLRRSFSAPGSRPVDIFGVAAALAEGQDFEEEADELAKEFVPKQAFLQEANELLEGALETQQGLERDLQSGVAKDKQQEAQELVRNRRMAIVQLQEIIALAKSIRT